MPSTSLLLCDCTPVILPLPHFNMQQAPCVLTQTSSPTCMDPGISACRATGLTFGCLQISLWYWFLKLPWLGRYIVPKHCFSRWYTSPLGNRFYDHVVSFYNPISTGSVSCPVVSLDISSIQCFPKDLWTKCCAIVHQHLFNSSMLKKKNLKKSHSAFLQLCPLFLLVSPF